MGNDPNREAAACGHPALELQRRNPGRRGRRRLRHAPRPLRVLPLGDRQPGLLRRARRRAGLARRRDARGRAARRDRARDRPEVGRHDPELLVHHPEPLRRRPRLPVQQRAERRLGARRHRRASSKRGCRRSPARPRFARTACWRSPSTSPTDAQSDSSSCCEETARAGLAAARHHRARRRQDRRGAALAVHQARHRQHDPLQPLLLAGHLGVAVRPAGAWPTPPACRSSAPTSSPPPDSRIRARLQSAATAPRCRAGARMARDRSGIPHRSGPQAPARPATSRPAPRP